jgi:hypothetical protein
MDKLLRPNEPNVISEPMEEELVVINLETGCYYSLNSTAAVIWHNLEKGVTPKNIAEIFFEYKDDSKDDNKYKIESFCNYLKDERLMIESNEVRAEEKLPIVKIKFEKPVIEKFSDMQEMLLLDPIHEVDDKGWPHESK